MKRTQVAATRGRLDRSVVVDAALALLDGGGWRELTLARLAAQLEVRTPSLYNHIDGLPGLRREIRVWAVRELSAAVLQATAGKSKGEAVLAAAQAYRALVNSHPAAYATLVEPPDAKDAELKLLTNALLKTFLAVLSGYQLKDHDAIHALRGLRSLVHGFATLEAAGGFGLPTDVNLSFVWLVRTFTAGLQTKAGN